MICSTEKKSLLILSTGVFVKATTITMSVTDEKTRKPHQKHGNVIVLSRLNAFFMIIIASLNLNLKCNNRVEY